MIEARTRRASAGSFVVRRPSLYPPSTRLCPLTAYHACAARRCTRRLQFVFPSVSLVDCRPSPPRLFLVRDCGMRPVRNPFARLLFIILLLGVSSSFSVLRIFYPPCSSFFFSISSRLLSFCAWFLALVRCVFWTDPLFHGRLTDFAALVPAPRARRSTLIAVAYILPFGSGAWTYWKFTASSVYRNLVAGHERANFAIVAGRVERRQLRTTILPLLGTIVAFVSRSSSDFFWHDVRLLLLLSRCMFQLRCLRRAGDVTSTSVARRAAHEAGVWRAATSSLLSQDVDACSARYYCADARFRLHTSFTGSARSAPMARGAVSIFAAAPHRGARLRVIVEPGNLLPRTVRDAALVHLVTTPTDVRSMSRLSRYRRPLRECSTPRPSSF